MNKKTLVFQMITDNMYYYDLIRNETLFSIQLRIPKTIQNKPNQKLFFIRNVIASLV